MIRIYNFELRKSILTVFLCFTSTSPAGSNTFFLKDLKLDEDFALYNALSILILCCNLRFLAHKSEFCLLIIHILGLEVLLLNLTSALLISFNIGIFLTNIQSDSLFAKPYLELR